MDVKTRICDKLNYLESKVEESKRRGLPLSYVCGLESAIDILIDFDETEIFRRELDLMQERIDEVDDFRFMERRQREFSYWTGGLDTKAMFYKGNALRVS